MKSWAKRAWCRDLKIAVIGAGAIGGLFGGLLSRSGHDVVFVERPHKVERLSLTGLELEMPDSSTIHVKAVFKPTLKGVDDLDICIVAVKAYDTASAVKHVADANLKCPVILLQNGLGVEGEAQSVLRRSVARGVTSCGAMVEQLGVVKVKGIASTVLGAEDRELVDACRELAKALSEAGLPSTVTENVMGAVWTKAIVNSSINPLGTIMNVRNGELLENEHTKTLMAMVAAEGWKVALSLGVRLEVEDPIEEVFKVAKATYDNKNSMLMDLVKGKRTEVDYINGAIWRLSSKGRVEAPFNRALYLLVKALEAKRLGMRG
ncbi:MAG: 2-dehydropantoate 2-reductase [Thermoprotei archaeon]|nr:MAG: 2-dehydropantoate 2-reductase [Thermoprotei archaeon]